MWQQRAVFLRPLGVGERIDAAIKIVRRSLLTFMKAAVIVAIPAAVVGGAILLSIFSAAQKEQLTVNNSGVITVLNLTPSLETIFGGLAALEFVEIIAGALITAIAVRVVADAYLGHPSNWRQALGYGARRFGSVLWIEFVILLAILVPMALIGVLVGVASAIGSGAATAVVVVLGIAVIVGLIWFWVSASLAVPVLMTEDIRGWKAVRRSVALCRKQWWSVFGTLLLAFLLLAIGTTILRLLIDFLLGLFGGGDVVLALEGAAVSLLTTLLLVSFVAAVQVVITIDLRVRKEGFDIQLLARQMGSAPTASAMSFLPPPPGGPGWGYGGYPGSGGYPPPPGGGYPHGTGPTYPTPPGYGYPPPGSAPPQGGWESVAPGWTPGWSQPGTPPEYPSPSQYPPPWNQQPPASPSPPPYGEPQAPAGPFPTPTSERPLPPFRPRTAPSAEPGADSSREDPTEPHPPEQPPEADPGGGSGG